MNDWLEPRTRIPLAGIIAIVLIVAVVAVFLKSQLSPLFPESEVRVSSTVEERTGNVAGRASSSFIGLREVPLTRVQRAQGILSGQGSPITFTVGELLAIERRGSREDVLLHATADGTLTATFEYEGSRVRVDIFDKTLRISGLSAVPIDVTLVPIVSYEGSFLFNNEEYLFRFYPAGGYALVGSREFTQVPLAAGDGTYAGVWNDGKRTHPVVIDTAKRRATIEEVW